MSNVMSRTWDEFVDGWSQVATADEARDGIERLNEDRPKSKSAAVEVATHLFKRATSRNEVEEIATELLAEIRADGIKQWARELTKKSLKKDDEINAIIDEYFSDDDDDSSQRSVRTGSRRRDGGGRPDNEDASNAVLRCGKRRTTSKEYYSIGEIGADSSWRSQDLNVSGQCLKCRRDAAFEHATGQNLAAATNQLLDLLDPRKWIGAATKADFNFFRCSFCKYLQKVCAECDEICETTASQCKGCGHAFGWRQSPTPPLSGATSC